MNPKDRIANKKPPIHLVPPTALVYLSRVMELGAKKYGLWNWRAEKVNYSVYVGAALRHLYSAFDGEEIDKESGQSHLAHAMACCAILLDAQVTGNLIDDRPTPGAAARLIAELTEKAPVADRSQSGKSPIGDTPARRETLVATVIPGSDVPHGPHRNPCLGDRALLRCGAPVTRTHIGGAGTYMGTCSKVLPCPEHGDPRWPV